MTFVKALDGSGGRGAVTLLLPGLTMNFSPDPGGNQNWEMA